MLLKENMKDFKQKFEEELSVIVRRDRPRRRWFDDRGLVNRGDKWWMTEVWPRHVKVYSDMFDNDNCFDKKEGEYEEDNDAYDDD